MSDAMDRIVRRRERNTQAGPWSLGQKLDELHDLGRNGACLSRAMIEAQETCERLAEDIKRNDILIQSLRNEILSKYNPSELEEE